MMNNDDTHWTAEDSARLYNIKGWGSRYFGINEQGHLTVHPRRSADPAIDIRALVDDVAARGIRFPVLFRFQDILRHRVEVLNETFSRVMSEKKYTGRYFGVYPIKVNQLREVVEEIIDAGRGYRYGLEAGSKGELMAVLAMNSSEALTIVNGYKDKAMMTLSAMGNRIGRRVVVVIEKPAELPLLLAASRELGVRPLIGLRAKLQTQGSGRWKYSTGHAAKFGLSTPEILGAVSHLRDQGLLDCAKLLHFHIGSQVSDIKTIKDSIKEACRIYAKLKKMGLGLEYLDCGGGLGVDYDGTHTSAESSVNYTLREYIGGLVSTVQEVCAQEGVPEPHLVTESGRAVVAHHSLLAVNVFGSIEAGTDDPAISGRAKESAPVAEMRRLLLEISAENLLQSYHEALERRDEAFSLFKLGFLDLEDKARIETLFWSLCLKIDRCIPEIKDVSEELLEMSKMVKDQYLCNFSLFQSLPDSWAIGQLFPIAPLQRLNEKPTRNTTLADITCDSDGKIAQFACHRRTGGSLPLHPLRSGEPYYLGVFLMGAYQATMGDIHNLFGRVNEVHVFQDKTAPGGYYLEEIIRGQTVREVLASIQYSDFELVQKMKSSIDAAAKAGIIKPREGVDLLNRYQDFMGDYTYIEHEAPSSAEESPGIAELALPRSKA
ncbi:MAG: biosynthetic arginine decarboxylase [Elusimicrobiota bacterium]